MPHRVFLALGTYATWLAVLHTTPVSAQTPRGGPPNSPILQVSVESSPAFERGLAALAAGDNAAAVDAFQSAFDADADPAALLNLGIAYTNLAQPAAAIAALSSFLEHADPGKNAQNIELVRAEIDRLRRESAVIELHLLPDFASVEIDHQAIRPEHGELRVAAGVHTIHISASGYLPFDRTLDVQAGRFSLDVELKSELAVTAVPEAVAPAQEAAPADTAELTDEMTSEPSSAPCALSDLCLGPVLALLGPPNLVGAGVHMRLGKYIGAGFDFQALPTVKVSPISVGASLVSANARVYPFGGAFFVGAGIGYQILSGAMRDGTLAVGARTSFPAASLNLGFMGHDGFVLGADIGVLLPLGAHRIAVRDMTGGKFADDAAAQAELDTTMSDAQDRLTRLLDSMPVLMQVNLVRVGYLF